MTTVLALGAAAGVTWFLRVLTVTIVPAHQLPAIVREALPHVGPAVLAALITASLLTAPDHHSAAFGIGAAATAFLAWRGHSALTAVLVGLVVVAVLGRL
ncbi:AzlD domain-containing protein [Nocardioides taihuensis]|uniref:AzlD domain-containing protein n=1 Tax=Nocardioides taihuensis TaxID=1835606 RepID=A0ABW0BPN7_9ACTN